jgi:cation diffusion facilitator CzcD-associated flavoprotein CzcO
VAVVGTGATAVQAIPEIAQQAKQVTVFQRTANGTVNLAGLAALARTDRDE